MTQEALPMTPIRDEHRVLKISIDAMLAARRYADISAAIATEGMSPRAREEARSYAAEFAGALFRDNPHVFPYANAMRSAALRNKDQR